MSRKVCLTLYSEHTPPHELLRQVSAFTDWSIQTRASPHHVTHVIFALAGTEELGQRLHYRSQ